MSNFGICSYQAKHAENIGTLFRSAYLYGASSLNTVGRRYSLQSSDTVNSIRQLPYYHFQSFAQFKERWAKKGYKIIAVELSPQSISLPNFNHPTRGIYLLGNEAYGIHEKVLTLCDSIVTIPTLRNISLNVAVAGSIVLADRFNKEMRLS